MLLTRLLIEHLVSRSCERTGTVHFGFGGGLLKLIGLAVTLATIWEVWAWFTVAFHVFGPMPPLPWGG